MWLNHIPLDSEGLSTLKRDYPQNDIDSQH